MTRHSKTLPFALLLACSGAGLADGQGAFPGVVNPWAFERPQLYAPAGYNPYGVYGVGVLATPPRGDRLTLQAAPVVGGTLPGPASQALYPTPMGAALGLPYGGYGTVYGLPPGGYGSALSPWGGPPLNGIPGAGPVGGGLWPGFW
ncbi:MAG: hypothetical protein KJ558_14360 [Gammaproteobacteria bacterium]|nr:hypothetical protein [Gammaproteobacteria bacterium]MBU1655972.1 hypothetical protein [Gammaproteobacteria bacterium]MBU1962547.1 hypothetical protein [Gammaproteobacteria bacterium]